MKDKIRILHLEDEFLDAELMHSTIRNSGMACEITHVKNRYEFESTVDQGSFDIILCDFKLPDYDGFAALKYARAKFPDIPFILLSGTLGEEQAVESLKRGATDYILKQKLTRLAPAINRALADAEERREREAVEQQLRLDAQASENRFRTLVEQSLVGIYVIEGDRLTYVNPVMGKILGYTPEEITSRPLLDFIAPEDRPLVSENVRKRMEGVISEVHYTLRMLRRDQSIAFVEAQGGRIDLNGHPAIMGTLLDITERKRAEEQIRKQAALLDKARDAIVVCGLEGHIIFWNKGAEKVYGWDAIEVIGRDFAELVSKTGASRIQEAQSDALKKGEWMGELTHFTKDGKTLVIQSHSTSVSDENHNRSILIINTDITNQKELENQYLRAQRIESIGILASGIAHDLNNVLSPILMGAELLQMTATNPKTIELSSAIEKSAKHGAELIKQILAFGRGVGGERVEMQIGHLIKDVHGLIGETFPRSLEIQVQVPKDLWTVKGAATQLHQILMNLCVNARDAMPQGGRLDIKAENINIDESYVGIGPEAKPGSYVVITVCDTGTGIPPEVMERIYDPFFTTKEIGKGTGLGLSTVKSIIKNHEGFIHVYSELGKGTRFKVYVPAVGAGIAAEVDHQQSLPRGNGELVLIVEDEPEIRKITAKTLERYGYSVITAKDGVDGLGVYVAHQQDIKLVLTDMMMPMMGGAAMVVVLRKINPKVKVIALSGMADAADLELISDVELVPKPFLTEQLLVAMQKVLKAP